MEKELEARGKEERMFSLDTCHSSSKKVYLEKWVTNDRSHLTLILFLITFCNISSLGKNVVWKRRLNVVKKDGRMTWRVVIERGKRNSVSILDKYLLTLQITRRRGHDNQHLASHSHLFTQESPPLHERVGRLQVFCCYESVVFPLSMFHLGREWRFSQLNLVNFLPLSLIRNVCESEKREIS